MQRTLCAGVLVSAFAAAGMVTPLSGNTETTRSDKRENTFVEAEHQMHCVTGPNMSVIFAPGTPQKTMDRINAEIQTPRPVFTEKGAGGVAYQATDSDRWPNGTQGDPSTLRWSVPDDGLFIPGNQVGGDPSGNNNINALFTAQFGSVANGFQRLRDAFDQWEAVTGVDFVEVSDDNAAFGSPGGATRGDIRIYAKSFGGGNAGVLAATGFPPPGGDGDMIINSDADFSSAIGNFIFMRNTVTHELGHALGIEHNCPADFSKLMEPVINTFLDGPQFDDIRAGQRLYGDANEADNTFANAVPFDFYSDAPIVLGIVGISGTASDPVNGTTTFGMPMGMGPVGVPLYFPPLGVEDDSFPGFFVAVTSSTRSFTVNYVGFDPGFFQDHAFTVSGIVTDGSLMNVTASQGSVMTDGNSIMWSGSGAALVADPYVTVEWELTPVSQRIDDTGVGIAEVVSIDDNSDIDFHSFEVGPGRNVSIALFPDGFGQPEEPELPLGGCANDMMEPVVDSSMVHDLRFDLIDTDGSTVLMSVNDGGLGAAETLTDFILPSAGTYFIRVQGSAVEASQLYSLAVVIDEACDVEADLANDDCCVDQADLGVLLASFNADAGGDINGDGETDQADLGILLAEFNMGLGCP